MRYVLKVVYVMSIVIPESNHATALKQVWMHEEPDTVCEDRSCISTITGCALPTDIVNHRLKIAIEIQSAFHDVDYQMIKDKIKKNYWIERGYSFYAVDHRDYTIIDMIKIFFPYISEIPEYVDFDKKSIDIVQLDLDGNFIAEFSSIESAEHTVGCAEGNIRNALKLGRNYSHGYYWVLKDEFDSGEYNIVKTICRPIVQLSDDGEYICEFPTISSASKQTGINEYNIRGCLKAGRSYACGFHWIEKDAYDSGDYVLSHGNPRNTPIPIICFDKNWNIINRFDSIKDGAEKMGVKQSNIRQAMHRGRTYSGGYHWVKEQDYIDNLTQ